MTCTPNKTADPIRFTAKDTREMTTSTPSPARRVVTAVAGLLLATATMVNPATADTVEAASPKTYSYTGGTHLRFHNPSGSSIAYLRNGTPLTMHCWTDARWAKGNYWTNRWFQVTAHYGINKIGYVHASLVRNQASVPRC